MRTFELRVYTLGNRNTLDFYVNESTLVISKAFRCLGLRPTAFGPLGMMPSRVCCAGLICGGR